MLHGKLGNLQKIESKSTMTINLHVLVFIIGFPLTSDALFAQQAPRIMPEEVTAEEARRSKIFHQQIRPQEKELDKLKEQIRKTGWYKPLGLVDHDLNEIKRFLTAKRAALSDITYHQLRAKCYSIDSLRDSIDETLVTSSCEGVKDLIQFFKNEITAGEKAEKKLRGENKKKQIHKDELVNIEDDISTENDFLAKENRKLDQYNKNNKSQSLDDFLSSDQGRAIKRGSDDFLASHDRSRAKDTTDFLADTNEKEGQVVTNDSFLTEDTGKAYKIDGRRNGSVGVIDNSGNILIPYRKWHITEYKNGIARVQIEFDSFECNAKVSKVHRQIVHANKIGFVDGSGEFIDGYKVWFYSKKLTELYLTSSKRPSQFDTYEQYEAYKRSVESAKKRQKLAIKQCRRQEAEWKNKIIGQHTQ